MGRIDLAAVRKAMAAAEQTGQPIISSKTAEARNASAD
jgi:hypothetical protein